MNVQRSTLLTVIFAVLVLNFQNCGKPSDNVAFSSKAATRSEADSGQPYDGKIYVVIGELCPDQSNVQSRIILKTTTSAELNRKDCQDIAPVALTSSQYQIDALNPNQLTYENKTYTAVTAATVGAGSGTLPKLTNPVDPTNFGAKGDGVTDNTAAFTSALAAGDMLIPAGTYVVTGTVKVPAGKNIQCISTNSVKIISPTRSTAYTHMFQFWTTAGGSISNCTLSGASTVNPNGSADFNPTMSFNLLVGIVDYWSPVSNVHVINNVFENCHGNACVSLYGGSGRGVSNSVVSNNTFKNCGFMGVIVDAGSNNTVGSNHLTDCGIDIANDNSADPNLNNIVENNYLKITHGNGLTYNKGPGAISELYLSGGTANGADYSTNTVRYNTVVGNGSAGSILIKQSGKLPAKYTSNSCTSGCTSM